MSQFDQSTKQSYYVIFSCQLCVCCLCAMRSVALAALSQMDSSTWLSTRQKAFTTLFRSAFIARTVGAVSAVSAVTAGDERCPTQRQGPI